jgi:hypothetical protein
LPFASDDKGNRPGMLPRERMTHLGTDFGMMGPAGDRIRWRDGQAIADTRSGDWAGIWHSLAGLGRDTQTTLDFLRVYPTWIVGSNQPRCTGIVVRLSGQGQFRLEIKSARQEILWSWRSAIDSDEPQVLTLSCNPAALRAAKFLNWIVEPGGRIAVDSVGLRLEFPSMSFAERVFLISYAKLARCYDVEAGVVKNRAHWPTGSFDAVPASGLFALATASAWTQGIVGRSFAEQVLQKVHATMMALPHADGWLPHYIRRASDGQYSISPGTEFSTIDSSFYFHGMLLAAQILDNHAMLDQLSGEIRSLRFDRLIGASGYVNHGFREDGKSVLRGEWNAGGGESILVILLELMATGHTVGKTQFQNWDPNGVGFIGEVQSLFYSQFDSGTPDALTGYDWYSGRRELLNEQEAFFAQRYPDSFAAKVGLYGLSAGEAFRGQSYVANGTRRLRASVIHPHYILMAGRWQPARTYALLQAMEQVGLLPPWGLVENVDAMTGEYFPMIGSLNAAFECLGAYHMWARWSGSPDAIDIASESNSLTAAAIRVLYPKGA